MKKKKMNNRFTDFWVNFKVMQDRYNWSPREREKKRSEKILRK